MQIIYLIMIGLITGCVVGLTGASGVVVVVPLLTVLMGFPVHMAIGMWVKSTRPERPAVENSQIKPFTVKNAAISFGIGLALGIFSGMFGAGGGIAFLIVMITVLKYSTHVAIGTSSLIMSLTAASGTIGYAIHGNVNFGSGLIIAIGSVVGGLLTARLANKVNEQTLEKLIGCVFAGLGVIMLIIE